MTQIQILHNRHLARLLDDIERIIGNSLPQKTLDEMKYSIKKELSFYTNDIQEQVIAKFYDTKNSNQK